MAVMKTVNDILKSDGQTFCSIAPGTSVSNAIELMVDKQVDVLPVLKAGKLVGIVSEEDCIKKVILKRKSTEETRVRNIMTRNIISATPAQTVEDCLEVMTNKDIEYLPVMADASLLGFISMRDLLTAIVAEQQDYIYRLENYVLGIGYT